MLGRGREREEGRRMATVQCPKCTAERKGFRRELDSWRHKLIHCVGFESILEGIYGQMLLSDLQLFYDCEPEEVDDWSPQANVSQCSFCNLPLEKFNDHAPSSASPLSSPCDYSPCPAPTISESSQSAHRFLQAVFHKKDVPLGCDSNIPLVAQELMKKMIHQFALEYASECLLHANTNGVTTKTSSLSSEASDAPLDLTVSRAQEEKESESEPDGVLDLSNRNSAYSATLSAFTSKHKASGRQSRQKVEYIKRSLELTEGLLSKALKDIRSGRLLEQRAALLYGIPLHTLRQGLDNWAEGRLEMPHQLAPGSRDFRDEMTSYNIMSSMLGGEARLVLQKVAAWAEGAEIGGAAEENGDLSFPSSSLSFYQPRGLQKTISHSFPQLRDALQPSPSPTPSLEPTTPLRIPQVRSMSDHNRSVQTESCGTAKNPYQRTSSTEGTASSMSASARPSSIFKLRPPFLPQGCQGSATQSSLRLGPRGSSLEDSEDGAGNRDKDKQPRKKRGRYRQYDHDLLEEAITMVMAGRMSVSKAQGIYGVPHSTLEYKVKERAGTLKNPPKKKSANYSSSTSNSSGSGSITGSTNSGTLASAADAKSSLVPSHVEEFGDLGQKGIKCHQTSALDAVLTSLCPSHCSLLYQILKLAHQENLLLFLNHRPIGQIESHCFHCGANPEDNVTPNAVSICECKAHNSSPYHPLIDCDHQGHGSTMYHPGDCKPNCSIHQCNLTNCKSEAPQSSRYCCLQRPRIETYTVLCPKRLHYISCRSLAVANTNNIVCSFTASPKSSSLCTASSSVCPSSSICCKHQKLHSCPCYSNFNLAPVRNTMEKVVTNGDPPCPVLKREQSPSPPPLSPIPSDINKKTDEKPPSLFYHRQEEEADLMIKDGLVNVIHQEVDMDTATEDEHKCQIPTNRYDERNQSGTLLQDVVNRFSEKLETITPMEKDPPVDSTTFYVSEKESVESASTSQNLHFHADAHLTEIITTVLHTGSASDYNLSELFNRHDSKEPKSPNTRSRRRQEVLAAMATPTNDASTRRHTLQIKRELAMFDQSHTRRKVSLSKRAKLKDENVSLTTSNTSSESNIVKQESLKEIEVGVDLEPVENHGVGEITLNIVSAHCDQDKVKKEIIVTEEVPLVKSEKKEREISNEEKDLVLLGSQIPVPELKSKEGKMDDSLQTQVMTVTASSAKQFGRAYKDHSMSSGAGSDKINQESPSGSDSDNIPGKCKDCHSKEARRSRRNIVPPQRFSSFVTESRKMYFVACFSENIFNKKIQKDKAVTFGTVDALSHDPDTNDTQQTSELPHTSSMEHTQKLACESAITEQCGPTSYKKPDGLSTDQEFTQNVTAKEKHSLDTGTGGSDCGAKVLGRLRSTPKRLQDLKTTSRTPQNTSNINIPIKSGTCVESPPNFEVQYTSPIKLMFVSPVKDKKGVRYSLKSANPGSSGQAEEPFDPYEESSWCGALQKDKSQNTESAVPQKKSVSSPLKSATSPTCSSPKSALSSRKIASSPTKTSSPSSRTASSPPSKSASSPPGKSSTLSPAKTTSPPSRSPSLPPARSSYSPAKPVFTTPRLASSPRKSSSSPIKSLRSASSSPKISPKRSSEGTPTKRGAGTENQRSPVNVEITPPKRRPGRPKKLGPQLEQKVKRPIGRPRKEKNVDSVVEANTVNGKFNIPSDLEENVNKNLKITVVYGRSRRNKRTVSEGFGQLQTEFHDACQEVGLKSDLDILMHSSNYSSGSLTRNTSKLSEDLNFVSPVKESAPQSSSNIKCQKKDDSVPLRKPGRPAKVKISGISVTVTTMSPRQRRIQINKNTRQSPKKLSHTKVLLPEFNSSKEPLSIRCQSTSKISQDGIGLKDTSKDKLPNQPVGVRHSMRVRKPSVHFLHAVATSTYRSYSHSNALLRRSKQLLLNKVSNERKRAEQESKLENSVEKKQVCGQRRQNISHDLSRVAGMSLDSIFTPKETLRWWAVSTEENTMNQELARRIQLISDTWVSDTVESQKKEIALNSKLSSKSNRKSRHSSVVRTLFDCPPNKPRSCSMQQLCSWFMQTTETQSLAIVKKASSRNPYELMHFPRSANKSICHSPQAERLRKHIKKFAKTVPKSPLQHKQAQRRLKKRDETQLLTRGFRRQLFSSRLTGRFDQGVRGRKSKAFRKYQATLVRARTRFLNRRERDKRQKNKKNLTVVTCFSNGELAKEFKPKHKRLHRSMKYDYEDSFATRSVDQIQEPVDDPKEQYVCSKAWSPETLKECRVFLRKINSPDNESTEEEWDSCTVTLDNGLPPAYLCAGRKRELAEVVKAVKTERKMSMKKTASREQSGSSSKPVQEQDEKPLGRRKGKYKHPVVSTVPPPAKMFRQSRMKGLTGPRWCDFVFEN